MRSISLYAHVPFCRRRCPYCTFYHVSHPSRDEFWRYADAVAREFELAVDEIGEPFVVPSVYLGGGTPSLLDRRSLERIVGVVRPYIAGENTEITIEANPEDVDEPMLSALKETGFNRLSLGVQSLTPRAGRILNRCDPSVNRKAIKLAARDFLNVSFDLLLGIPGGSAEELTETFREVELIAPKHLSVYCLEPGGDAAAPDDDFFEGVDSERCADEYLVVCERLAAAGYRHYEISNFAVPGFESMHNQRYWDGSEYLGLGPSAHSFIGGERFFNLPSLSDYLRDGNNPAGRVRRTEIRGRDERELEELMLGLRTSSGYSIQKLPGKESVIKRLLDENLGRIESDNLVLTDRGFLVLNEIVHRLSSQR
jgi:oxygen-independent coproporphyrinogen-3 oxidase